MSDPSDRIVEQTLQDYLHKHYPEEELLEYVAGAETPDSWWEAIMGMWARRGYYLGLTKKRIVLIRLSFWTAMATDNISEILLGRIEKIALKRGMGLLNPTMAIHYGEGVKRRFIVGWTMKQSLEGFCETYEHLPKPMILTEEENRISSLTEEAYKRETRKRMIWITVVIVVLVVLVLVISSSK
jgi:hypothetical protein